MLYPRELELLLPADELELENPRLEDDDSPRDDEEELVLYASLELEELKPRLEEDVLIPPDDEEEESRDDEDDEEST